MAEREIADRIRRGLGLAARAIGEPVDAYRPAGTDDPLRADKRFLRLPASFVPPHAGGRAGGGGDGLWDGVFDAAYTRPGDYLVRADGGIWFVAAQYPLQPALCVRAQRRLSFRRPSGAVAAGATSYGGVVRATASPVLLDWPAAMLPGAGTHGPALATDSALQAGSWLVLLPPLPWLGLLPGDTTSDELGRAGVVERAECTELAWRVVVQQATA